MSFPTEGKTRWVERLHDIFETDVTKLVLSVLIILSVMPRLEVLSPLFFVVFALELGLRVTVMRHRIRRGELDRVEMIMLIFDFVAVLSFLPLEQLLKARFLRLLRLSRMLMLLGYWKPVVKEIWIIINKRERRYQLMFVASSVVLLTFTSAILLYRLESFGVDYNGDGQISPAERFSPNFWTLVWWSFRQLQDPGNLMHDPGHSLAFLFSIVLTMSGIFIIAFLIGMGTTIVEELVRVGRERRLGLRGHSVIANLGRHSKLLVDELVAYYAKSFRSPRLVTMGQAPTRYEFMYEDHLRRVRYRQGTPNVRHDLIRVDADRARRVILLGQAERRESDAEVISQMLSVREVNGACLILAELFDCSNVRAALLAGGNIVPILSQRFLAMLLGQIVTAPGADQLYDELLSTRGHEIYTCVFGSGAMAGQRTPKVASPAFKDLIGYCHREHGVTLLGYLRASADPTSRYHPVFGPPTLPPTGVDSADSPIGMFGVATNFEQLKNAVIDLGKVRTPRRAKGSPAAVPPLVLQPIKVSLQRVLICGFHDGLVEICEQLLLLCQALQLHLMVPSVEQRESIVEQLLARNPRRGPACSQPFAGIRYHRHDASRVDYSVDGSGGVAGSIHILTGDWSNERDITGADHPDFDLQDMQTVVLTYATTDADPDARTALGLLKMLQIRAQRPDALHAGLRVICMVRERNKADLFARRFSPHSQAQSPDFSVTIVRVERLRNAFVAQSVFVPGIWSIYDDLLGHNGTRLHKLRVERSATPEASVDFAGLLETVFDQHGLIALAAEIEDAAGRRLIVKPTPDHPDYRFPASSLRAVYAAGTATEGPMPPPGGRPATGPAQPALAET